MNVGELRAAFEALVDDTVDNAIFLVWLNESLEDISTKYGPVATSTITALESGAEYNLPSDFLKVIEVVNSNNELYLDYEISELGTIAFADADTYNVKYHRMPTRLVVGNDLLVPEIHELLHSPMYLYAASMYYDRESTGDKEESEMASKLMLKYEATVERRVKALKARRSKQFGFSK
jgi:hypothetical protein